MTPSPGPPGPPHFSVLPPEVNSARMFGGAGPSPILAAATAWDGIAAELHTAAMSFESITATLTDASWQGAASVAMAEAAAAYIEWLSTSATQADAAAGLARSTVAVFEAALAATVHPAIVATNRAQLATMVAVNLFGQNTPVIAALEACYEAMWAQDVEAMAGYHAAASALVSQLVPWQHNLSSAATTTGDGPINSAAATNATAAQTIAQIMGGSGIPMPSARYVQLANELYISRSIAGAIGQALFTPEGLYPVVAIKNLTFDASVAQGVTILEGVIRQQIAAGNNVAVYGYSQSATISSLTMANLASSINPPSPEQLSFTLIGSPQNPNGGVATRFPGISFPSLGITAFGPTPDNLYPTKVYTIEYDGVADFPRYPLNLVSTLNALAGVYYVHSDYLWLTPGQIDSAVHLSNTVGPTMTDYYIIRTENLPLLEPLRAIPVLGNPLANLIQPNLKVIVNLGYGDPGYGYSTAPPNVATPFGVFPNVHPVAVLDALNAGTQEGIRDFAYDIAHLDVPPPDLSRLVALSPGAGPTTNTGPSAVPPAISINTVIDDLQTGNTKLTNTITRVAEASYATLLPTADLVNSVLTTAPSYNINLFLDGIQQAVNGDPLGLVNAIGYPIAADVALLAGVGMFEVLILATAGQTIGYHISALA